jgi:hypothetical protein
MAETMFSIAQQAVPEDALLMTYRGGRNPARWGRYGDCFSVPVDRVVSLADFVMAFYSSWVFRIERALFRAFGASSSSAQARAVADGSGTEFAVWYVGDRSATQLLMCDRYERTRSWFRVVPLDGGRTLLQFGSAVASAREHRTEASGRFRLLLGFHVLYSQVLLHAAKVRVMKASQPG